MKRNIKLTINHTANAPIMPYGKNIKKLPIRIRIPTNTAMNNKLTYLFPTNLILAFMLLYLKPRVTTPSTRMPISIVTSANPYQNTGA